MAPHQNQACHFVLAESDITHLLNAATSFRDRLLLKTLYLTGLRRQELSALTVEDVDFERSRLHVRAGKGGKSRIVPIPETLVTDLKALLGRRSRGPVFASQKGGPLSTRAVSYVVENAGRGAGLRNPNPRRSNINPHLLRHTFARHYLKHGGQMHKLSQILGHANVAITHAVYGTASEVEIHEEYQAVIGQFAL